MDPEPQTSSHLTLEQCIDLIARQLDAADLFYGHGAVDADSEALWLLSKELDLSPTEALDCLQETVKPKQLTNALAITETRISTRKPLAYILGEAWLMGGYHFFVASKVLFRALGLLN